MSSKPETLGFLSLVQSHLLPVFKYTHLLCPLVFFKLWVKEDAELITITETFDNQVICGCKASF